MVYESMSIVSYMYYSFQSGCLLDLIFHSRKTPPRKYETGYIYVVTEQKVRAMSMKLESSSHHEVSYHLIIRL
jgi:hypothetical protein